MVKRNRILLEIGPGYSPVALKHKAKQRIMLDVDRENLKHCRKLAKYANLGAGKKAEVVQGALQHLPFADESFSRVEARMVPQLYSIRKETSLKNIDEVKRVIKKGGVITISAESPFYKKVKKDFTKQGFVLIRQQPLEGRLHDTEFEGGGVEYGGKLTHLGKRFWFKKP